MAYFICFRRIESSSKKVYGWCKGNCVQHKLLFALYLINDGQEIVKSANPWLSDLNVFQKVANHFEAISKFVD